MTVQRIEDAIARLEAVARQSPPALAQAQAKNEQLREAVVASLGQIDALIARNSAIAPQNGEPQR